MNACHKSPRRSTGQQAGILAFLPFLLLASCAAAPFLIPAGIEFARNLLVTGNKNFGGKYSEDMNRLMVRLSTPYVAMGLPMGTSPAALVPPGDVAATATGDDEPDGWPAGHGRPVRGGGIWRLCRSVQPYRRHAGRGLPAGRIWDAAGHGLWRDVRVRRHARLWRNAGGAVWLPGTDGRIC